MDKGKQICSQLKELRRSIAQENGIDLKIQECTYKGPCRGTCPRCDAEVRQLENSLAAKLKVGKAATIAGLTLALAGTAHAQAPALADESSKFNIQNSELKADSLAVLFASVTDQKTHGPMPLGQIFLMDGDKVVCAANTDLDGMAVLRTKAGTYTLVMKYVGYDAYSQEVSLEVGRRNMEIALVPNAAELGVIDDVVPIIEGDAPVVIGGISDSDKLEWPDHTVPGPSQTIERDGIKVTVQY